MAMANTYMLILTRPLSQGTYSQNSSRQSCFQALRSFKKLALTIIFFKAQVLLFGISTKI